MTASKTTYKLLLSMLILFSSCENKDKNSIFEPNEIHSIFISEKHKYGDYSLLYFNKNGTGYGIGWSDYIDTAKSKSKKNDDFEANNLFGHTFKWKKDNKTIFISPSREYSFTKSHNNEIYEISRPSENINDNNIVYFRTKSPYFRVLCESINKWIYDNDETYFDYIIKDENYELDKARAIHNRMPTPMKPDPNDPNYNGPLM